MEKGLTKPQVIAQLTKSPHGDLSAYIPIGQVAVQEDPNFFAHLVAWNHQKGVIRDARVALPVIALSGAKDREFVDNALAHMASLDPRSFIKALDFARTAKAPSRLVRRLVERFLREKESSWGDWERTAIQHRKSMKTLYARYHVKPTVTANLALFANMVETGRFGAVKQLSKVSPEEAARLIVEYKIPFLIAQGALGKKAKDPDVLMALIKRMTPTELVTNMKSLEKLGVRDHAILRAALEDALVVASTAKTRTVLKTTKAVEAVSDPALAAKMRNLQERQLDTVGKVEGRWLILGDKSGSMNEAIGIAKQIAAFLSRMASSVSLVFFDTVPYAFDTTGKTLEEIAVATRHMCAAGGTSIGCGLANFMGEVDGIVIVSDGGENTLPYFSEQYQRYETKTGLTPSVYFYQLKGDPNSISDRMLKAGLDMQTFDLRDSSVDYYSLPNMLATMRAGKYALLEEVMATPLLTLDKVLPNTVSLGVMSRV